MPTSRAARVFGAGLSGQLDGPNRRDFIMGAENKATNKVTEAKGDLKQAGEKVKDAFKK